MDRALDDVVRERQNKKNRSQRRNTPKGGIRKPGRNNGVYDESRLWVHDKFEDDPNNAHQRQNPGDPGMRDTGGSLQAFTGIKIKVENIHYDLGEDELMGLFRRQGTVAKLALLYDRAGRSEGIAYVTYNNEGDAQRAIEEYDGANANGQPIRISLVPRTGTASVAQPRSLFERIKPPGNDGSRRARSADGRVRDPTRRPTPPGIDRYVPPERRRERERSERTTTGPRSAGGLRDRGGRGRGGGGGRRDDSGTQSGGGGSARSRKTVEELDAEMNDYFGAAEEVGETNGAAAGTGVVSAFAAPPVDEDADMIL